MAASAGYAVAYTIGLIFIFHGSPQFIVKQF